MNNFLFKNLRDRLYLEFIEILMQNDDPKRINQDLKEKFSFVKDFWVFINKAQCQEWGYKNPLTRLVALFS